MESKPGAARVAVMGLFFSWVPVLLAYAGPPRQSASDTPLPNVESACAQAPPDREYFIPEAFSEKVVPSNTGRHGYEQGCPFWVVDFSMNSKSNTYIQDGVRIKESTNFDGIPTDLPSSSSSAHNLKPGVLEDCKRYRQEYIIYTKYKHEPNFVLRSHNTVTHKMAGTSCYIPNNPKYKTKAPDANVLVVRVATRTKLRTSWQETAARAADAPPE